MSYVDIGKAEGATLLAGGGPPEDPALSGGYFFTPTVFGDVENGMRIAQEEIFGPVIAAGVFDDEDELIAKANGVRYGLAGGVWTQDIRRAHRVGPEDQGGDGVGELLPAAPLGVALRRVQDERLRA